MSLRPDEIITAHEVEELREEGYLIVSRPDTTIAADLDGIRSVRVSGTCDDTLIEAEQRIMPVEIARGNVIPEVKRLLARRYGIELAKALGLDDETQPDIASELRIGEPAYAGSEARQDDERER